MSLCEDLIESISKFFKLLAVILFRDIRAIFCLLYFKWQMFWVQKRNKVLVNYFDDVCQKYPSKIAVNYLDESFTFEQIAELANRISLWIELALKSNRIEIDDRNEKQQNTVQIGLMLSNIPEFLSFVIGIARVRCATVFFNTNHRKDTLINAFEATDCKIFIFESKFLSAIEEIVDKLPDIKFFMFDRSLLNEYDPKKDFDLEYQGINVNEFTQITKLLSKKPSSKFATILNSFKNKSISRQYNYSLQDIVHYIFTSGTTGGKVKAAAIDNIRYIAASYSDTLVYDITEKDNLYLCLPCYHSLAGVIGFGCLFLKGSTLTIAKKFSASKFWNDCRKNRCTIAFYIGEICRYLLGQPVKDDDDKHQIRLLFGSGLKKEIWIDFQKRFKVRQIGEIYGATEANIKIFNIDNKEGSCGFIPYYYGFLTRLLFHIHLVRVDPETFELMRDQNGRCILARPGELGMLIGIIPARSGYTEFLGYSSVKESSKKIVKNILKEGDSGFKSDDLMLMDFYGYCFFQDRIGDTFRWKGENVSTSEVENIIAKFLRDNDGVVFGVSIPNTDGNAGMLAISDPSIDLDGLLRFMRERISDYAIPRFIRVTEMIEKTSTFKYMKTSLRNDSFHLERMRSKDLVYYFDRQNDRYRILDSESYERILNGSLIIS
ncbi:phosphoribosylaminoimidazole carboxylase [Sarcoptes scabiei]|nr:phosphoribosylaminoimidazole carboxylase [Sarcoptes scabiei]